MKQKGFLFLAFCVSLLTGRSGKRPHRNWLTFKDMLSQSLRREKQENKEKRKKKHMVGYLLSGGDKGLSPCVGKYLCCVSSEPIKVRRREVPLIWHMEEFGLILSYERRRAEFFRFIPLSAPRKGSCV